LKIDDVVGIFIDLLLVCANTEATEPGLKGGFGLKIEVFPVFC
jgi:hypothetical protein